MSREKRRGRSLESMLENAPVVEDDYLFGSDLGVTPRFGNETSSYRIDSGLRETPVDEVLGRLMHDKRSYDIPIALIDRNPHQPRLDFDERDLADLADSEGIELTDEQLEAISGGTWYNCMNETW